VKLTVQLDAEELCGASEQVPPDPKDPPDPLDVKLAVPLGALVVPGPVSVTVAVQELGCPTVTLAGEQLTAVAVGRFPTLTVSFPCVLV
jgi:hypothetical protein